MDRRTFIGGALTFASCAPKPGPGAFPSAAARGWLRLSSNENPLGMSPLAAQAVHDHAATSHQYPWIPRDALVARLAAKHRVDPASIVLGAGATQVMMCVLLNQVRAGAKLVVAEPTYEDVIQYAAPWKLEIVPVPLDGAHGEDLARMAEAAGTGPALVYVCNPHNPCGTIHSQRELDAVLGGAPAGVTYLVDEAYYEYAAQDPEYGTAERWIGQPNVVVVRTFSKVWGLAGLRLGYGLAHPDTAALLRGHETHHTANHLALHAALASLDDPDHVARSLAYNDEVMRMVVGVLDELGLDYIPSHTSFVSHRVGDVERYVARMRERQIWVGRVFPALPGYDRLSLGTTEDMVVFLDTLRDFRARGWI